MLFTAIFALFGVLMWVAAGVVLYFRRKQLRKTDSMRRTETSPASDAAKAAPGTPVEVTGTLRCAEPLTSEMAGQPCAYYVSRVIREYREADRDSDEHVGSGRRSEVVAESERFAPFAVEDSSGTIAIRGEGAEVDALEVTNRFEKDAGGGSGITIGGVTVHLDREKRTIGYRYEESILPLDSPVYALGYATGDGGIGAAPSGEGHFLLSRRSEAALGKKYGKTALVLGLVAAALFVFGAVFLAIGLGVGLFAVGTTAPAFALV